jgi:hypothetical protein
MRHPLGSRTPVARGTVLVVIPAVLLAPASSFALAAGASPQPDARADVPPTSWRGGIPARHSLLPLASR